jgi:predicted protein tyrosine phosphatase
MKKGNSREFSRVPLPVRARFKLAGGETLEGKAHDVSMNGVFIETAQTAAKDAKGQLTLIFEPNGESILIHGHGRVTRSSEQGIGIQIDEMELEGYEHLRNLILYNAPDPEAVVSELDEHLGLKRR